MQWFNNLTVKNKLLVLIIPTVSIVFLISFYFILSNVNSVVKESAYNEANEIAKNYVNRIEMEINKGFVASRVMAQVFAGYRDVDLRQRQELTDAVVKKIIKDNSNFKCVWTEWENEGKVHPGLNSTERFSSTYIYENNEYVKTPPVSEQEIATSDYFQLAKKTMNECIIEPYKYTYTAGGKEYLITSISVPVIEEGKFIGVAGVDFGLDYLQELLKDVKPYETGYVTLFSNAGVFVTHPKKEIIGKKVFEVMPETDKKFKVSENIKNGKEFNYSDQNQTTKEVSSVFVIPIKIGRTNTTWSLGIVIPDEKILAKTSAIRNMAIVSTIISILIIAIIIFFISTKVANSIIKLVKRFDLVF